MNFEQSKIEKIVAAIFLIIGGALIAMGGGDFQAVENPDKELKGQAYLDYWARLNEAYKKDNYGGATPEETLNLFIEALKAGDLELASKYFAVEKQEIMLNKLLDGKQSGGNILFLKIAGESMTGHEYDYSGRYEFTTGESGVTIGLVLNRHTNKWKMEEL